MNAHVPNPGGSAAGRPQLDTEVLVVQQADLIRHLAEVSQDAPPALSAVAAAIGKDASNLRKSLDRLHTDGLVYLKPLGLTEAGRAWLPRIAALKGELATGDGLPPIPWLRIRPDPDNPRKIDMRSPLAVGMLRELAENIARRGLIQPIRIVLDEDRQGGMLNDGERRYRAIGMLIEAGDVRWPAAKPIPYTVAEATDPGELLADALITSIHKKNLHPLEEAEALRRLKEDLGWTPARILEETGFERRTYENRLDLLHLTPAQKDRMRLDPDDHNYLSQKGARLLLQHLRGISAAAAPTEGQQLDIEARAETLPIKLQLALLEVAFAVEQKTDRGRVALTGAPDGALATLAERYWLSVEQGGGGKWSVGIPKTGFAMAWLNDFHFFDNPTTRLAAVRTEVLGPTKHDFLLSQRLYATEELNTDPAVYNGKRFPNATHANEARRLAEGGGGGASSPARPAVKPEAPEARASDLRLLLEIAHAISQQDQPTHGAPAGKYWLDAAVTRLVQDFGWIKFLNAPGEGWRVHISPNGFGKIRQLLDGREFPTDADLEKARNESGQAGWRGPEYVTSWLNVDTDASPVEHFSAEVREAALAEQRKGEDPGRMPIVNPKLSGTSTIDGETWPARQTEVLKTPWDGYPRVEIGLTTSSKGRWHVTLCTQGGGPDFSGQSSPPYVYGDDPLFRSRAAALEAAAPRIVEQLKDWGQKKNLKTWLAELLEQPDPISDHAGDGEDDEQAIEDAAAAAILAKVDSGLKGPNVLRRDAKDENFDALLKLAGLEGPFVAQDPEMVGEVRQSDGDSVATVDVGGELHDDLVKARALLIAYALNHCC